MFIQATRSYEFKGKGGAKFKTEPLSVVDAPEWIADDPLFAWCVKDGTIKTVERNTITMRVVQPLPENIEIGVVVSDATINDSEPSAPEKKKKSKT